MSESGITYSAYKVADDVAAWEGVLARTIAEINPLYFELNPRFKGIRRITSSRLVDYLGVYEEGDWWVLVIVEVVLENHRAKYLFLPLTAQASSVEVTLNDRMPAGLAYPAFEIQTSSEFHGIRNWKMVDAFSDSGFHEKMLFLFLSCENVPETHVNAYVELHKSGLGKFVFQTSGDLQTWLDKRHAPLKVSIEFSVANEMMIHYGDTYRLSVHGRIPDADSGMLTQPSKIAGRITYQGAQMAELVIGVLIKHESM